MEYVVHKKQHKNLVKQKLQYSASFMVYQNYTFTSSNHYINLQPNDTKKQENFSNWALSIIYENSQWLLNILWTDKFFLCCMGQSTLITEKFEQRRNCLPILKSPTFNSRQCLVWFYCIHNCKSSFFFLKNTVSNLAIRHTQLTEYVI